MKKATDAQNMYPSADRRKKLTWPGSVWAGTSEMNNSVSSHLVLDSQFRLGRTWDSRKCPEALLPALLLTFYLLLLHSNFNKHGCLEALALAGVPQTPV